MKKRLISTLLAMAICSSMGLSAFAAESGDIKQSDEGLSVAYMDLDSASETEKVKIIAAREEIICNESWVADNVNGRIIGRDGKVKEELPHFSEIFPSDWEQPNFGAVNDEVESDVVVESAKGKTMDDIDEPTQYTTVLQYPVGRSTSLPSRGMKLDSEDASYYADIVELGNKWLYTNKYFYQTATIVCDFSIGYKAENSFVIGCYDMTAKTWLSDQETFDMPHSINEPTYLTGVHAFTGLDPSHHYAVAFKCNNVGKYTYLTGNCNITNWDGYIAGLD